MKLSAATSIDDVLKEYPFVEDFLPTLSPKFKKLKNPLVRKTLGKVATLEVVANMGGMEVNALINDIENEISRKTGKEQGASPGQNTLEARKEILRGVIRDLHDGVEMAVLKQRFADLIKNVSPSEISELEQGLIDEGMPESEVKRLCDVHVEVFKQSLEKQKKPEATPGHPVHTFMLENRETEKITGEISNILDGIGEPPRESAFRESKENLGSLLDKLFEIDKHYLRKENQLFPILESHGVSGPTQVMWAIHDDIRADLKRAKGQITEDKAIDAVHSLRELVQAINDMVYKEEHILYPMSLETLAEEEWAKVRQGEEEIGYAWILPDDEWKPKTGGKEVKSLEEKLSLEVGSLTLEQVNLMLKHLPVDISFVDENDRVVYYSGTKERIFPRSPGVIGREVRKCHPPKSVHMVQQILDEFKAGNRDAAEFWIELSGKFIHIRYFAIRDADGNYKGTLEVSQDVTGIKTLEGQKRLLDWK